MRISRSRTPPSVLFPSTAHACPTHASVCAPRGGTQPARCPHAPRPHHRTAAVGGAQPEHGAFAFRAATWSERPPQSAMRRARMAAQAARAAQTAPPPAPDRSPHHSTHPTAGPTPRRPARRPDRCRQLCAVVPVPPAGQPGRRGGGGGGGVVALAVKKVLDTPSRKYDPPTPTWGPSMMHGPSALCGGGKMREEEERKVVVSIHHAHAHALHCVPPLPQRGHPRTLLGRAHPPGLLHPLRTGGGVLEERL